MSTFAEAIAQIGATAIPGTDLIVASMTPGGGIEHAVVANVLDREIPRDSNIYLAGGSFMQGSVSATEGRSAENVRQVLWLQFDADLSDYAGMEASYFWAMPQDQLNRWIEGQQQDLEEVFRSIGLPIHRLDYTGYGLCAYLYLEPGPATDLQTVKDAHKAFIAAINETAGMPLVDKQVSDSGTRITRIPGSWNVKNPELPREVRTILYQPNAHVTLDQLRFALKRAEQRPQRQPLPSTKELPGTTLEEIVTAVAPYWTLGQKHAISLALAGMFAKSGVPEEQALAAIERLSADDHKPWDRQKSVRDSYARLRSGLQTQGFYGLREMLPASVLTYVSDRLDRFEESTTGVFRFQVAEQVREHDIKNRGRVGDLAITPIPAICFRGWVGDYVSMMLPLSEAPESFHLGAGLGLMGASAGRRVSNIYVSRPLYGNQYIMLVGLAGESRKDTAIEFAINFPKHQFGRNWHDAPFKMATDIGSSEGLIKILSDQPNTWLYITEYQRLSRQAKRASTGTIFSTMISAWNTPPALQNLVKGSPLSANLPYLSTIAAVQPRILAEEMSPEDIENGFASRWIFIPGEGRDPIPYPPNIDERDAHKLYGELLRTLNAYEKNDRSETRLTLTPAAIERWTDWYVTDRKREVRDEDEASIRSRLGVHAQKLALLYAASAGAPAIDLDHLESGIALIEWSWSHTRQMMRTWGVPVFNQIENRIEHVLRERGPMKRGKLQAYSRGRKWGAREFAQVLTAMHQNEQVSVDPEGLYVLASE